MARQLTWSPEAVEDIEAIAAFIERDSPWYAQVVASRIIEVAESIPEQPEMGRVVPEIGKTEIRERLVYSYRVIYRVDTSSIMIAAVIHGSRLLEAITPRIQSP